MHSDDLVHRPLCGMISVMCQSPEWKFQDLWLKERYPSPEEQTSSLTASISGTVVIRWRLGATMTFHSPDSITRPQLLQIWLQETIRWLVGCPPAVDDPEPVTVYHARSSDVFPWLRIPLHHPAGGRARSPLFDEVFTPIGLAPSATTTMA